MDALAHLFGRLGRGDGWTGWFQPGAKRCCEADVDFPALVDLPQDEAEGRTKDTRSAASAGMLLEASDRSDETYFVILASLGVEVTGDMDPGAP